MSKSYKTHTKCLITGAEDLVPLQGYEAQYLVRSKGSGLTFVARIPEEQELIDFYGRYGRGDGISSITIKRYEELLDRFEPYRKNNLILDTGCGNGHFLACAKARGWEVYGNEYTKEAVAKCEEKGITTFLGPLRDAPFEKGQFDLVTSFEVIEHLNNPVEEVGTIRSLLREEGLFYLTTPNFNSLERRVLKQKSPIIGYPEHLALYTPRSIDLLLSQQGYQRIKVETTGISIANLRGAWSSRKERKNTGISPTDERIRESLEGSWWSTALKNAINLILNVTRLGSSMKGYYTKR